MQLASVIDPPPHTRYELYETLEKFREEYEARFADPGIRVRAVRGLVPRSVWREWNEWGVPEAPVQIGCDPSDILRLHDDPVMVCGVWFCPTADDTFVLYGETY